MDIRIKESHDFHLIAKLNKEVQELHTKFEPQIFKKHNETAVADLLKKWFENNRMFSYVAFYQSTPIGYILFAIRKYIDTAIRFPAANVYIHHICVSNEYRRFKVGERLINQVKSFAQGNHIYRIELDYWIQNVHAGKFFDSQGFKPFNTRMYLQIK